jgi:Na+-transporting methylmalonyl-CoA/oxaloacetate decarboxylase gamma subunit
MGVATASSTFFRQMGGTLGTAIFLSILFSTVGDKISGAFRTASATGFDGALADPAVTSNPANAQILGALRSGNANATGVLNDSSFLQRIDARLARPFLVGFTESMTLTFLIVACVLAVAFVLVLFIKELPLRTMSGAQARLAEEAGQPEPPATVGAAVEALEQHREPALAGAAMGGVGGAPPGASANGHPPVGSANGDGWNGNGTRGRHAMSAGLNGDGSPQAPHLAGETGPVSTRPFEDPSAATGPIPVVPAAAHNGGFHGGEGPAVSGIVHRADGTGLAGAVVTLTDPAGRQEGRTTTDREGNYRIAVSTGGTYLVVATSGTFQPYAAMVAVADRPVRHDVPLAGTSGVRGTIRDADGTPVGLAMLTLIDARGDVAATGSPDATGRYTLAGVPEGRYTLTITGPAFQPVAQSVELGSGTTIDRDVALPRRARLVGTVVAASDGRGVGEALATLIDARGTVVASTVTAPDGSFAFEDLPGGAYTLTASGYAPVASIVQVGAGEVTSVDVEFPAPHSAGAPDQTGIAGGMR